MSGSAQGSGVRTAANGFTSVLESAGHEVTVLPIDNVPRRRGNRLNLENVAGVARDLRSVWSAVRRERPAVVWFHTLGFPLLPALRSLAIVAIARLLGVPVVTHLHAYGLVESALALQPWSARVVRLFGRLSSRVITLHEASCRAVSSVVSRDHVTVLRNVVRVPRTSTPIPDCGRRRLVFVGGLISRKGAPELLEAMRMLDESYELHVVGGAGEDGAAAARDLIDRASDLVASGRVVFEGELQDDAVREQLRRAHVFVLPSSAEGTPIALLEAMSEGRPVIVADAGDMGEIVGDARCGVVLESRSAEGIATAISQLFDGGQRALSDAGERGHRAAVERYSPTAAASAVVATLQALNLPDT